jgi:hypothetical protein
MRERNSLIGQVRTLSVLPDCFELRFHAHPFLNLPFQAGADLGASRGRRSFGASDEQLARITATAVQTILWRETSWTRSWFGLPSRQTLGGHSRVPAPFGVNYRRVGAELTMLLLRWFVDDGDLP